MVRDSIRHLGEDLFYVKPHFRVVRKDAGRVGWALQNHIDPKEVQSEENPSALELVVDPTVFGIAAAKADFTRRQRKKLTVELRTAQGQNGKEHPVNVTFEERSFRHPLRKSKIVINLGDTPNTLQDMRQAGHDTTTVGRALAVDIHNQTVDVLVRLGHKEHHKRLRSRAFWWFALPYPLGFVSRSAIGAAANKDIPNEGWSTFVKSLIHVDIRSLSPQLVELYHHLPLHYDLRTFLLSLASMPVIALGKSIFERKHERTFDRKSAAFMKRYTLSVTKQGEVDTSKALVHVRVPGN